MIRVLNDVTQRQAVAEAVRAFLASEISSFEFEDRLDDSYYNSNDPVVRYVAEAAWLFCVDDKDELVCLEKPEWDFFQRLLLLLEADSHIEEVQTRSWFLRQRIAAAAVCGFVACAWMIGWNELLILLTIPFGILSMAIAFRARHQDDSNDDPCRTIIFPFATFSDLERAYHATSFRKTRYPRDIAMRKDRPTRAQQLVELLVLPPLFLLQLAGYAMWLLWSPLVLLWQACPETHNKVRATVA